MFTPVTGRHYLNLQGTETRFQPSTNSKVLRSRFVFPSRSLSDVARKWLPGLLVSPWELELSLSHTVSLPEGSRSNLTQGGMSAAMKETEWNSTSDVFPGSCPWKIKC